MIQKMHKAMKSRPFQIICCEVFHNTFWFELYIFPAIIYNKIIDISDQICRF